MTAPLSLACPHCGGTLTISMETVGGPYLSYERPESIECDEFDCGAAWESNGAPRTAPRWERYPDLYEIPSRVATSTPPGSVERPGGSV